MRSTLPRLALCDAKMTAGTPRARAAYATPCPKLPAETATIARPGPILPSPASAWTTTHVPRPLNERIGLTVSTLTMTGTPRRRDRPSWTYCGEWVKAGSIRSWASRIASAVSSGIVINAAVAPGGRGCGSGREKETPEGTQIHSRSRQCKHRQDRFWFWAPSGKDYVTRRDPPTGRDLSTSFRVRRAASCEGCPHDVHEGSPSASVAASPADMKTPEGTAITSCSNPCKQRSDHEMFAAPSGRTTIRRVSRRRHTADGPNRDNGVATCGVADQSTSSGRVSPSARTGKPSASISNGLTGLDRASAPWRGARRRSPGPHRARRSPGGPRPPMSRSRPRRRTTPGATRSRQRSAADPSIEEQVIGPERQPDDVPDGPSARIDVIAVQRPVRLPGGTSRVRPPGPVRGG